MNTGKALLGILTGFAAGAALGIIFAPEKGIDSRRKISRKGQAMAEALNDKIEEKFNELIDSMSCQAKSGLAKTVQANIDRD